MFFPLKSIFHYISTYPNRESQIRASRLYRQRKKEYLKEIEVKLQALQLENSQLKKKNQSLESQLTLNVKPSPLFRSYSEELQTTDKDLESIALQLKDALERATNESEVKTLLHNFHEHMKKRQEILSKEVQQFANPKLQERLVRLVGVSPKSEVSTTSENELIQWFDSISKQGVSVEQKESLKSLQAQHAKALSQIYRERENIHREIREYYKQKLLGEQIIGSMSKVKLESSFILVLSSKLDLLKKNIQDEGQIVNNTVDKLSVILTPYQEAILMLKHYNIYRDKLNTFQVLNNIWKTLGDGKEEN